MKRAIICILFSIILFQSCKKDNLEIIVSYQELFLNDREGVLVAHDVHIDKSFDTYRTSIKKQYEKAIKLIENKVEKIKVSIDGDQIENIQEF